MKKNNNKHIEKFEQDFILPPPETKKEFRTHDVEKLEAFFKEVAKLTLDHDVVDDHAVIYASRLGAALEKVDFEWWKQQ
jgi:hypothetical protein